MNIKFDDRFKMLILSETSFGGIFSMFLFLDSLSVFAIKKRAFEHNHNELYSNISKMEIVQNISWYSENRFLEQYMQFVFVSGRDPTTITTAAGKGGSEKKKSSNEGRTHSCTLLRRPTTLS